MITWHYENGTWTETSFMDEAWGEGEDLPTVRERLGFKRWTSVGDDNRSCFEVSVYSRDDAPRFLVQFSDCSMWEGMTANTLPDALDLLARYAPIVTAGEIAEAAGDIRELSQYGLLTDIMAGLELNEGHVATKVRQERETRERARREAAERRREREREKAEASGASQPEA